MDKPNLERCGHCGGEATMQAPNIHRKTCVTCKTCLISTGYGTAEEVAATWNRRTTPENNPLTVEELRGMVGAWVWVIVQYENGKCNGWALVATPAYIGFLEQTIPIDFCGRKFVAYRRPPEKEE